MPLTASDLFCLSQGTKNGGSEKCHWCNSACIKLYRHDDPGPRAFVKQPERLWQVKCPTSLWMCLGCWMWKRRSVTVNFLDGRLADRQRAEDYGWLITAENAWAIRKQDSENLLKLLRSQIPLCFSLSLIEKDKNKLQCMTVNDHQKITGETRLSFTLDGKEHHWTPFELEDAIAHGSNGKEAGTRFLAGLVPEEKPSLALGKEEGNGTGGRPLKEKEQLTKLKSVVKAK